MVRELEAKVQDQEEELDEQAGRLQQLEQVTHICCCPLLFDPYHTYPFI